MDTKLVSILMPAYNGEKFIRQAIESVLLQTYQDWELIVVDDGSVDQTAGIVDAFKDRRIRYVYQNNRGQAAALNHGLELAQGAYITTLDVDDWFTPNSISERVYFLEQHPEHGVVYGDGVYCDVDSKPLMRFSEYRVGDVTGEVYAVLIATPFFGTGGNVLVRREVFENYHIRYDEALVWCQDYDIYIRIAEQVSFGLVDMVTIWYRLHETNMTMTMPEGRRLESLIRMKRKVLASSCFSKIPIDLKYNFFYQTLLRDFAQRVNDQLLLIEDEHFRGLPKAQQASLLRLLANYYLLADENIEFVKRLLNNAWSLQPFNPKTIVVFILVILHPGLAKWLVGSWQRSNMQKGVDKSPFQMAKVK